MLRCSTCTIPAELVVWSLEQCPVEEQDSGRFEFVSVRVVEPLRWVEAFDLCYHTLQGLRSEGIVLIVVYVVFSIVSAELYANCGMLVVYVFDSSGLSPV